MRQRVFPLLQIGAAAAAFLASAVMIGMLAQQLPERFVTPVQGLALWGGVGAAALLLRRSGSSLRKLGFARPDSWLATFGWAAAGLVLASAGSALIGALVQATTDWPPIEIGYIRESIEGDTIAWLAWMLLVVWGSAAFGEELLFRGFVFDRLNTVFGTGHAALAAAMVGQAAIFGAMHAVQGPSGILTTAYIGLVLGGIYLASGRNLWAPILAHGIADTVSLTMIYRGVSLPGYFA